MPEVQLPFEDAKVLAAMVGSSALSAAARRGRRRGQRADGRCAWPGAPALALRDSQLAAYHGVEHKAIAAYEQGTDAALAAKEHDRCGSNLVAPMIVSTTAGNVIVRSVLGLRGPLASATATLAGVAVSVRCRLVGAQPRDGSRAGIPRPGYEMQRLFATREPTTEQLEVGRAALAEILRREKPDSAWGPRTNVRN